MPEQANRPNPWRKMMITQRDVTYKYSCLCVRHGGVWGSGSVAPPTVKFCTRWEVGGQLQAPVELTSGQSPWYPLRRRLAGPKNWSGRFGEQKNLFSMPGIEPRFLGRGALSMVYRLCYPVSDLCVEFAVLLKWVWYVQCEDLNCSELSRDTIQ